ncbi:unannotated protein [freshwater metagenome]|uniref:Unannotated protein n=1 Tax=freshwater metagenome TaxID=449393 RepID=A0A6J7S0F1_9ZZZZ|nr:hypothetical protein [Actinomycetota bacterium]
MVRALSIALLAAAVALVAPAAAGAGATMKTGVADDGLMQRTDGRAEPTAAIWQASGVEQSRVAVVWELVAPDPSSVRKPKGFDARNPDSPDYNWTSVDTAVTALRARGIKVELSVTTPAPIWASSVPSRHEPTYKPQPDEFADFVHAVAVRYGSRIASYALINEPNLWQWLTPQWSCSGATESSCVAASPEIYRELFRAGYSAIKEVQPSTPVWGGSLAPLGGPTRNDAHSSIGPLLFLRRLGCVTDDFLRDRSGPGCRNFRPVTFDALAHHPHSAWRAPNSSNDVADSVTIGTIPRLTSTIDRIQSRGGVLNGSVVGAASKTKRLDVEIDEYGVQTNPPDEWSGVSLRNQDNYLQEAAYMMWKNSRVKLFSQYLWQDEPLDKVSVTAGSWQSGLYFADGTAKPSAASFRNPFWVDLPRHSRRATVWGQVRPGGQTAVTVQSRTAGFARYAAIRTVMTNRSGFFVLTVPVRAKTAFRFYYGTDAVKTSSVRTVTPR